MKLQLFSFSIILILDIKLYRKLLSVIKRHLKQFHLETTVFRVFFLILPGLVEAFVFMIDYSDILGDIRNYIPSILVLSSAERITTKVVVISELSVRKYFILRGFLCDIIRSSQKFPAQN